MANELNLNQQAAILIRSLMRDLRVNDHIVQVGDQTFSATGVCRQLEGYVASPKEGQTDGA